MVASILGFTCYAVRGFPSIAPCLEHVCAWGGGGGGSVTIEVLVLYAGGDCALYLNIVLLVQVVAYVMSGTFAIYMVRHWTCAPESGPLIGLPIRTILPAAGKSV